MEVKMYNENVPRAEHMLKGSFFGPWVYAERVIFLVLERTLIG